MADADDALIAQLRDAARSPGLPVARFMERCLFDSDHGFYARAPELGRQGHFFTNVHASRLFGHVMARQLHEMWVALGRPARVRLVEQGAHDGRLMADIWGWIAAFEPDFAGALDPWIVEPIERLADRQRAVLEACAPRPCPARHSARLDGVPSDSDSPWLFYCNELVDAFPVERVRFHDGRWWERAVVWEGSRFEERDGWPAPEPLAEEIARWNIPALEGYASELHLAARGWFAELARCMPWGFATVIDYGWEAETYYDPARSDGTLRGYRDQAWVDDPFEAPGHNDITAHVNFSVLMAEARLGGMDIVTFADQHHHLVRLLQEDLLKMEAEGRVPEPGFARAFQMLCHPELMGRAFKFLIVSKHLAQSRWAGLSFLNPCVGSGSGAEHV